MDGEGIELRHFRTEGREMRKKEGRGREKNTQT